MTERYAYFEVAVHGESQPEHAAMIQMIKNVGTVHQMTDGSLLAILEQQMRSDDFAAVASLVKALPFVASMTPGRYNGFIDIGHDVRMKMYEIVDAAYPVESHQEGVASFARKLAVWMPVRDALLAAAALPTKTT